MAWQLALAANGVVLVATLAAALLITRARRRPIADSPAQLRAEQRARDAETLFRTSFDGAPIGMALVAPDGNYLRANRALAGLIGRAVDHVVGTQFGTFCHPDDRPRELTLMSELLSGERDEYELETRFVRQDGFVGWVHTQVSLVRTADGAPCWAVVQHLDVTEQRRRKAELMHLADHDPLTGLLNRRGFERELSRHARLADRYGARGALLVLDLDGFKYINDTLGHHAGDALILEAARRLGGRIRATDHLARLGGDEFAVVLPEADTDQALLVAESLLACLRHDAGDPGRSMSASLGIAHFERGLSGGEVLVNADLAMYDAKEQGRDRVVTFDGRVGAEPGIRRRATWLRRIERAIADDGFELAAQPIVDLVTGERVMHELLVRMRSEDGELILPEAFLGVAEGFDLVQQIDAWVLREAVRLLASGALGEAAASVNVSAHSVGDARWLAAFEAAIGEHPEVADRLVLEVTETAAIADLTRTCEFGARVAALGCRLAIDDFGAGYGSFTYLKHLPFDYIKIDGAFVEHCLASPADQLVIRAVVSIAEGLGRSTIAEYVSDEATRRRLVEEGVTLGQGYHLGRPVALRAGVPLTA